MTPPSASLAAGKPVLLTKRITQAHSVPLTPEEQKAPIPRRLRSRVVDGQYHYEIHIADGAPPSGIGAEGDIWVDAVVRKQIYIRKDNQWCLWSPQGFPSYFPRPAPLSVSTSTASSGRVHSVHPWLAMRILMLDPRRGTLVWESSAVLSAYRKTWDERRARVHSPLVPEYSELTGRWLSMFLLAMASREDWVFQLLHHSDSAQVSASLPNRPPLTARSINLPSSTPGDVQCEKNDLSAPPASKPTRDRAVLSTSDDLPPSKPFKQAGSERPIDEGVFEITMAHAAADREGASASATSLPAPPPDKDIEAFLQNIPRPLPHLVPIFSKLGLTAFAHLQSLACLPPVILGQFFFELQGHGVTYIDVILLCDAFERVLYPVCASRAPLLDHNGSPLVIDSIQTFLDTLRPPLVSRNSTTGSAHMHQSPTGPGQAH